MAPPPATEDYYFLLQVEQPASLADITSSYRRLALIWHPDRNQASNATGKFQALEQAYGTLKDPGARRDYDVIYPRLRRVRAAPQPDINQHQRTRSNPAPPPEAALKVLSTMEQITALENTMRERAAWWQDTKASLSARHPVHHREISILTQRITVLQDMADAEHAQDLLEKDRGAWMRFPFQKKRIPSEEEKLSKDRATHERRLEKGLKKMLLAKEEEALEREDAEIARVKMMVDAADRTAREKIRLLWASVDAKTRQERMQAEAAMQAKARVLEQQRFNLEQQATAVRLRRDYEAAETMRRLARNVLEARFQVEREMAAELWRSRQEQEAYARQRDEAVRSQQGQTAQNFWRQECGHVAWWGKVQGRTACPNCHEIWAYLLQCPLCTIQACPRCQAGVRQRNQRAAFEAERSFRH